MIASFLTPCTPVFEPFFIGLASRTAIIGNVNLMRSTQRFPLLASLLILLPIMATCSRLPSNPVEPATKASTTVPITSSTPLAPEPTRAAQPSATTAPLNTATPQPTPTLPDDIREVTLVAHGVLPNWNYLFTFGFTEEVQGGYRLVVDQNKEYNCTTLSDQPGYLYCDGPMAAFDDFVEYKLISEDGSLTVLEGRVYIPPEFTP